MQPMLSIVVANYNYARFLPDAFSSIFRQCGDPVIDAGRAVLPVNGCEAVIELIVCDAESTDGSVEIIKANEDRIAWWCSEKDAGQSDAFNKGFFHARGQWLTWLNADDLYFSGVFEALYKVVQKHPQAEWITGNKVHFDSDSGRMVSVNWGPHCQPPLLRGNQAISAVFGPSTFFKKVLYERMGPIDERLHYAMDSAYWAKFTMAGVRQIRLNKLCWAFRDHTESKTVGIQTKAVADRRRGETELWRKDTGYRFEVSFKNVWYWAWALWRVIDGSWVVRAIMKHRYEGESIKEII